MWHGQGVRNSLGQEDIRKAGAFQPTCCNNALPSQDYAPLLGVYYWRWERPSCSSVFHMGVCSGKMPPGPSDCLSHVLPRGGFERLALTLRVLWRSRAVGRVRATAEPVGGETLSLSFPLFLTKIHKEQGIGEGGGVSQSPHSPLPISLQAAGVLTQAFSGVGGDGI